MSTFLSLAQHLVNGGLASVAKRRRGGGGRSRGQQLDRQSQVQLHVRMDDVKAALCPPEGSRAATARDAPPEAQQRFFQRLMQRVDAPGGSFYRIGLDQAQSGRQPTP